MMQIYFEMVIYPKERKNWLNIYRNVSLYIRDPFMIIFPILSVVIISISICITSRYILTWIIYRLYSYDVWKIMFNPIVGHHIKRDNVYIIK